VKHAFTKAEKEIKPQKTWTNHSAVVNDVQFHPMAAFLLGAVSDDLTYSIIDIRQPTTTKAVQQVEAHTDAVNCIAFNPHVDSIFVTGSADKSIAVWDVRYSKNKVHALEGHRDSVVALEWSPKHAQVLASASYDRRVICWDLNRIGTEMTPEELEDGPPEL
jgi:histone-binding protein RBBP4